MHPVLFHCGFFSVYTYGLFVALAFFIATTLLVRHARAKGVCENRIYNLSLVLLAGGILGARLLYVLLNASYFLQNPGEVLMLQHGGLVWFGGLIGALGLGTVYMRWKSMAFLSTADLFAPFIALAQSIGRIGCFFNGCCYGQAAGWGIFFPLHHHVLVPSQLISSLTLLMIFIFLRLWDSPRRRIGEIFCFYLMLAGLQRFLMEFIRGDERPFYFHLSVFQWISLAVFLAGVVLLARTRRGAGVEE